jgi:hypothetical protein
MSSRFILAYTSLVRSPTYVSTRHIVKVVPEGKGPTPSFEITHTPLGVSGNSFDFSSKCTPLYVKPGDRDYERVCKLVDPDMAMKLD